MLVETVYERRGFRFEPVITKPDNTAIDNAVNVAAGIANEATANLNKKNEAYYTARTNYSNARNAFVCARNAFVCATQEANVYYAQNGYNNSLLLEKFNAARVAVDTARVAADTARVAADAALDAVMDAKVTSYTANTAYSKAANAAYYAKSAKPSKVADEDEEVTYRKVPVLVPVGVMVGINDAVNGVGCIRIGWSRCRLPPANKPVEIPDEYLKLMTPEGISKYHAALSDYKKAVENSDKFDMERGIAQAIQNMTTMAIADKAVNIPTGRGFRSKYDTFRTRCYRYFKDVRDVVENGKGVNNPCYVPTVKQTAICNCPICTYKTASKEINKKLNYKDLYKNKC
jgi:hypothetical protein